MEICRSPLSHIHMGSTRPWGHLIHGHLTVLTWAKGMHHCPAKQYGREHLESGCLLARKGTLPLRAWLPCGPPGSPPTVCLSWGYGYSGGKGACLRTTLGWVYQYPWPLDFHLRVTSVTDPGSQLRVGMPRSSSYKLSPVVGTFAGSSRQEVLSIHWGE